MRSHLLPVLLAALFPSILPASPTHLDIMAPDIKDTDLTGPVKSIEFEVCRNVSDKSTKERDEYDRAGNLMKVSEWNTKGKRATTTTYFYDKNGCYTRQLYINHEEGITNDWTVVLSPKTHQIALENKRNGSIALETYSQAGYLTDYRVVDKKRKQLLATHYKRDKNNRVLKYTRYEGTTPQYTYYFKWKDNGFIDKERQHYLQEKAERLHTYEYLLTDSHGNWTQRIMVRYDVGGKKPKKVYEHTVQRKIEYYQDEAKSGIESKAESKNDTNAAGTTQGENYEETQPPANSV